MRLMAAGVLALSAGLASISPAVGDALPGVLLASYTQNLRAPDAANVIQVYLAAGFTPKEQSDISEALAEWNHTLNGHLRFDLRDSAGADGLTIMRVPDKDLPLNGPAAQWLAVTIRARGDTGLMIVYGDRIARYDLRRIMLHEVGHLLGLEHDDASNLMFPRYFHSRQGCVDRATVQKLASQRHWLVDEMNWCDPAIMASRTRIENGAVPDREQAQRPSRPGSERRMNRGAPWAHELEPPESSDSESPPELLCPQITNWPIDSHPWSEWMAGDSSRGASPGTPLKTP